MTEMKIYFSGNLCHNSLLQHLTLSFAEPLTSGTYHAFLPSSVFHPI